MSETISDAIGALILLGVPACLFLITEKLIPLLLNQIYKHWDSERLNPKENNPALFLIYFCGTMFHGEFRKNQGTYVAYQFLVLFGFPLIPIDCFRIAKANDRQYRIYGTVRWNFVEVIAVYIRAIYVISVTVLFLFLIASVISWIMKIFSVGN